MSLQNKKLSIGVILLLAYISISVFGLFQMNHNKTTVPMNDCPYILNTHAMCDNGLSHINHWREFSNFVFPTLFILSMILFTLALCFFDRNKFLLQKLILFHRWTQYLDYRFYYLSRGKLIHRLSLFENSPPVNISNFIY